MLGLGRRGHGSSGTANACARTADAREAVATTGVGRGGGGVLDVAGRVAWAQRGRGIGDGARGGEDRQGKEEDGATRGLGTGIYMQHPFTSDASPPPGVKLLYSGCVLPTGPLLPVGNTHRE